MNTLAPSFLIGSSSYLQVTRISVTSRTSSKFSQIGPRTAELAALEHLENPHRLIIGKCCPHSSSFISSPEPKAFQHRNAATESQAYTLDV